MRNKFPIGRSSASCERESNLLRQAAACTCQGRSCAWTEWWKFNIAPWELVLDIEWNKLAEHLSANLGCKCAIDGLAGARSVCEQIFFVISVCHQRLCRQFKRNKLSMNVKFTFCEIATRWPPKTKPEEGFYRLENSQKLVQPQFTTALVLRLRTSPRRTAFLRPKMFLLTKVFPKMFIAQSEKAFKIRS